MGREYLLLRFFSDDSHVRTLREGKIRMMSSKYYKSLEDGLQSDVGADGRFDMYENSAYIYNPDDNGEITLDQPLKLMNKDIIKIRVYEGVESPIIINNEADDELTKVYCFYALFLDEVKEQQLSSVFKDIEKFGTYYCIIHDTEDFVKRINRGIEEYYVKDIIKNPELKFVDYVDVKKFNGVYGAYRKPTQLSWQNELRFTVSASSTDPFMLDIGGIKDISIWGKVTDLKNGRIYSNRELSIDDYEID
ncbi:MAG: hypothetical protein CVV02_18290 [Firmicutes bacterium HGW-Firmicutes-7]|nr:MAG: hypothetical protein CVV02_18290 [Firmicutes bacterium HGW-Firmicutes-7]